MFYRLPVGSKSTYCATEADLADAVNIPAFGIDYALLGAGAPSLSAAHNIAIDLASDERSIRFGIFFSSESI